MINTNKKSIKEICDDILHAEQGLLDLFTLYDNELKFHENIKNKLYSYELLNHSTVNLLFTRYEFHASRVPLVVNKLDVINGLIRELILNINDKKSRFNIEEKQ